MTMDIGSSSSILAPGADAIGTPVPQVFSPGAGLVERQGDFAAILGRNIRRTNGGDSMEAAREAAEHLVASTLVQPILAQLRSTSMAAPPFAPTRGEQQFLAIADAAVAKQIVHASRFALVDRIAERSVRRPDPETGHGGPMPLRPDTGPRPLIESRAGLPLQSSRAPGFLLDGGEK